MFEPANSDERARLPRNFYAKDQVVSHRYIYIYILYNVYTHIDERI